jgi:hypothetical protein
MSWQAQQQRGSALSRKERESESRFPSLPPTHLIIIIITTPALVTRRSLGAHHFRYHTLFLEVGTTDDTPSS